MKHMMMEQLDFILGISSAISSLIGLTFYALYRSHTETARQIKNLQVWHPDSDLYKQLQLQGNYCLAYAAVGGVVTATEHTLKSQYGEQQGVIQRLQMTEHKSKYVAGNWIDFKTVVQDSTSYAQFALMTAEPEDSKYRVEVHKCESAGQIKGELDITHDKFKQRSSIFTKIGLDRLFGDVTKGVQETESMLLNGTAVLSIGKVFLDQGKIKITAPLPSTGSYIITKMTLRELVHHLENQSFQLKKKSAIFILVGGSLLAYMICRHINKVREERKTRLELEAIRNIIEANTDTDRDFYSSDEELCVVCLTNPRECVAVGCGHLALCGDCAECLSEPKKCPICRADVSFIPVYHP
ncbi:mitochondrial ubiquitin ligase activator of NFKB 1-like [Physella acuta]|uniref:mitochondrial ubiquitin ligase activator of NFKB 1-like n=1 Tax=Physella acuta TaxID=109671 RepID=UPI0027DE41E4|nr:mitochondrial ubiquitin ligase activator of NFKB 1-like [Physella acuta]